MSTDKEIKLTTLPIPEGGDKTQNSPSPVPASQSDVDMLKYFMGAIIVVLLIAFVTFIIQQFTASQTAFDSLKDQVNNQNAKIDILIQELSPYTK